MIKAGHHWFLYPFFEWYGQIRIKQHFKNVRIAGDLYDSDLPTLILPNHFSWWDGFFISYLNRKIFRKKFYVMMLEEQLNAHPFFRKTGAFPVNKNPKSIIHSMRYAIEILKNRDNLLAFFPQGQFESIYQQPIHFKRGLSWLLTNLENEIQVVFAANLTEYFDSAKPYLFIYLQNYDYKKYGSDIMQIEKKYNEFYKNSFQKNILTNN